MEFSANSNLRQFRKTLLREQRSQLPFATAQALTMTGRDAKVGVEDRIGKAFDRPTSFTKRAAASLPASKTRIYSRVLIKDRQAEYLGIQERGGARLPARTAIPVPVGARLNQYGNMPRGALRRLLARADTFSGTVRGIGGIWQRDKSGGVKLLIAYQPKAQYKPAFEFKETVKRLAAERFPKNFQTAFSRALETAR